MPRLSLPLRDTALALRLAARPGLAWLDGDGTRAGRFSYLLSDPVARTELDVDAPFDALESLALATEGANVPRYVVQLGYGAGLAAMRVPSRFALGSLGSIARYDACFVVDHEARTTTLHADDDAALRRATARLEGAVPNTPSPPRASALRVEEVEAHHTRIARAQEAIARGDLYQVNLARAFVADFSGDPLALYLAMRRASPVPFGLFLREPTRCLLGRSMERFLAFEARTRTLSTRPIKGTLARRGADHDEASQLVADPKEHAEHAMVVDLMRNDVSRVARVGTVEVEAPFSVEPYARLSHLVSTVRCVVDDASGLGRILDATMPPGSVTGTPKRRAVELIDALEACARDAYCGAYGYVSTHGDLSLAVAIRTATVEGTQIRYLAGGGIVHASDPARETDETLLKTRVLEDALAEFTSGAAAVATAESETW